MSDTLRINNEFNQKLMEPLKTAAGATMSMAEFLMKDDKHATQTEVTGGTWNGDKKIYSTTDSKTGLTTEYKVSKNMRVTSGFSVQEKTYKITKDEKGGEKRVQMEYDPKNQEWVKANLFKKAIDIHPGIAIGKAIMPKYMGTLVETKSPEGASTFSLKIEKAKLKPALA